ncbi:MAG: hypothetical protein ACYTG0_04140 [Planctomycetota bacterium]
MKAAGLDTTYSAGLLWLDDMIGTVVGKPQERSRVQRIEDKFPGKDKLEKSREYLERGWAKEVVEGRGKW